MRYIKYELKFSFWLFSWLLFIHGGAMGIALWLPLRFPIMLTLLALCVLSFVAMVRYYILHSSATAITQFWEIADNEWRLQTRNGQVWAGKLRGDSFRTSRLVILNFDRANKYSPLSVVIPNDALDDDSFRYLRVRLGSVKLT